MNNNTKFNIIRTTLSILIALGISFLIIAFVSEQPLEAITRMLTGPISRKRLFGNVIELTIPLIFTGLGVSIMFSARQINLASEGAFHVGGIVAALVALKVTLPGGIHPLVAILVAGLVSALFTFIPAMLKITTSASVIVSSLMLNYIALFFGNYILNHILRDQNAGAVVSNPLPQSAKLSSIIPGTNIHIGIVIALVLTVITYFFLYKSKMGYMIRVAGQNENFAKFSGINIIKVILVSQILGGFIAGMGGGIHLLGIYPRFSWTGLLGYGWDAVIVATLSKNNPLFVPIAAFFLAYIRIGADIISRSTDVTPEIVSITQGIIIILIVAKQFLSGYQYKMVAKEAKSTIQGEAK